jgi:hypothetical protein
MYVFIYLFMELLKYDSIRQTQLIYSLITIRLAACFDFVVSSSGLHYESVDIRKLRTFFGSQSMFHIDMDMSYARMVRSASLTVRCKILHQRTASLS